MEWKGGEPQQRSHDPIRSHEADECGESDPTRVTGFSPGHFPVNDPGGWQAREEAVNIR